MKKIAISIAALFGLSGCYYPMVYARHEVGFYPAANTIVYDSASGREYICTSSERLDTCVTRACFQSAWGVNNCVARTMGVGYVGIFPGVDAGVMIQSQPGIQFQYHHHDSNCNHSHSRHDDRPRRGTRHRR